MTRHITPRFGERERQLLAKLFRLLGTDNEHERTVATSKIDNLLAQHRKTWADVPALLAPSAIAATLINANLLRHISALGSRNAGERDSARQLILDLLIRARRSWNDLIDLLCLPTSPSWADGADDTCPPSGFAGKDFAVVELVHRLTEYYVALSSTLRIAVVLWILHSHVYDRFLITPRLAVLSPVAECGKTTLMSLIETLVPKPERSDSITPAALYHAIDGRHPTFLIDEGDNIGLTLTANGRYRAIFNSGHRKGGTVTLLQGGELRRYSTFAPLALAAIKQSSQALPSPLLRRSIVIEMQRYDGVGELRSFNGRDPAIDFVFGRIRFWAREVKLDANPPMPAQMHNRQADNWRPLIAIADTFGPEWGQLARDAAMAFTRAQQDEDAKVLLLHDLRAIFDKRGVDRIFSKSLVAALNDIEDAIWSEWRGLNGNQQPRPLSQGELATMLAPFGIRPRTIWPLQRTPESRSAKGYMRAWFEQAWRSYCDGAADEENGTASQSNTVRYLRSM